MKTKRCSGLCETVETASKTVPRAAFSPTPPPVRCFLMKEKRKGEGEEVARRGGGGSKETDAHIKHILPLWHRKRKTHDVTGSPCFLEPFKVTAARWVASALSTSATPYLDNGMLRSVCHVQKPHGTFTGDGGQPESELRLITESKKQKKTKTKPIRERFFHNCFFFLVGI